MIAVGAAFKGTDPRAAIGARSGLEFVDVRIVLAGEVERRGDRDEFALVHRANALLFLQERLNLEAGIDRQEANRDKGRAGLRTLSRLVLDDRGLPLLPGCPAPGCCRRRTGPDWFAFSEGALTARTSYRVVKLPS